MRNEEKKQKKEKNEFKFSFSHDNGYFIIKNFVYINNIENIKLIYINVHIFTFNKIFKSR